MQVSGLLPAPRKHTALRGRPASGPRLFHLSLLFRVLFQEKEVLNVETVFFLCLDALP